MNATTPYEQLIAEKLDQVPVPDMADSIWAGIEMQLGVPGGEPDGADDGQDASSDTSDAPTNKLAPKSRGAGWYGLGLVAVVAITLWWYFSLPKKQEPLPAAPPAVAPSPDRGVQPAPGVQSPSGVQPPPGGKKHKGVKGITDDDYKISAGKDSARKRN